MRRRMTMSNSLYVPVFAADYAPLHSFRMQHSVPALIDAILQKLPGKTTQAELAARLSSSRVKITQEQISRWKKGQEPKQRAYERLVEVAHQVGAIAESVSSEDIAAELPTGPRRRTVKLKGYVGAGAEAHYYSLADEDFEEVEAPMRVNDQTVAVEIKGTSLGPFFESWLVYYDDVRSPVTEDMTGRLCVVGLTDGRILIKRIVRDGRGGYNLVSNSPTEPPIENAPIEWAAIVTDMKPRL